MALQIRRGTNLERQQIIPLQGELIFTTDTKKLWVGDGVTQGGIAVDTLNGGSGEPGATAINELSDVVITSPSNGQVLKYQNGFWINAADLQGEQGAAALEELENIEVTNLADGQVLRWNEASQKWVNSDEVIPFINQIGGVSINAPAQGQVLKFDGLNWINGEDTTAESTVNQLNDLTDVSLIAVAAGQVLKWSGAAWVNADDEQGVGGGATVLGDLNDVIIAGTPLAGQVLKWNAESGVWTNQAEDAAPFSLAALSEDLTPSLGGNLNLNGRNIEGSGNVTLIGEDDGDGNALSGILTAEQVTVTGTKATFGERFGRFSFTPNNPDPSSISTNVEFICTAEEKTIKFVKYAPTGDFTEKVISTTNGFLTAGDVYEISRGTIEETENRLAVENNDSLALSVATAWDGSAFLTTSVIRHFVLGAVSEGTIPGAVQIAATSDGNLQNLNGIVVDSRGFVAINKGTNTPTTELDVVGTVKASVSLIPGVYADAAARDSAIATPAAGMMVFVTDVAKFQGYDGTAWINLN
jgi:hypothetical protein